MNNQCAKHEHPPLEIERNSCKTDFKQIDLDLWLQYSTDMELILSYTYI